MLKIYEELPALSAWLKRVRAIGHGTRSELSAQEALDIAKAATPNNEALEDENDPAGLKVGDGVIILTEDPGTTPVHGQLLALRPNGVSIKRHHERVGDVVTHFPRAGIIVRKA